MKTFVELFNDYWREFSDREVTKEDFEVTFLDGTMYDVFEPCKGVEIVFKDVYTLVNFESDENIKRLNGVEPSEFFNECYSIVYEYSKYCIIDLISKLKDTVDKINSGNFEIEFK